MKANGCSVLVVDDDGDDREALADVLVSKGYLASQAEHGAAAVALLEAGLDPDLILTDLQMPVMSGWELCDALKRKPAWRSIPIVVLCGMSREQRGSLRVDSAFEKPTDVATLLQRIDELCGL